MKQIIASAALAACLATATVLGAPPTIAGLDAAGFDTSVRAQNDLFDCVCGRTRPCGSE